MALVVFVVGFVIPRVVRVEGWNAERIALWFVVWITIAAILWDVAWLAITRTDWLIECDHSPLIWSGRERNLDILANRM